MNKTKPNSEAPQKTILVSGGAGYLGGSMVRVLLRNGFRVIALDNFATSHRRADTTVAVHEGDVADWNSLTRLADSWGPIQGVIHFAARCLVSESCQQPDLYFRNNLLSTLNLARLCVERGIPTLIHSSSCAVYGNPNAVPIPETALLQPISPYGETKRAAEEILRHTAAHQNLKVINLRYFNPAGSIHQGEWGEDHQPESHLVPNLIRAGMRGDPITIFGTDYDTPDGTCIRDFVHVEDLMSAHLAALVYLDTHADSICLAINVGSGKGSSVREVIGAVEKVMGKPLQVRVEPRRPGDPPRLVAESALARQLLGWQPTQGLEAMIRSHLQWETRREKAR